MLARAGMRTTVFEAQSSIGGGARSAELTLPGFVHDICSAVHPLAIGSPAFAMFPLAEHGLEWIQPPVPIAHPLDDGSAVLLERPLDLTCANLAADGAAYHKAVDYFVHRWPDLLSEILQPIHLPAHPVLLAEFGLRAIWPATAVARSAFHTERARALFAGLAAHSILPLECFGSAAFGWILAFAGHAVGWPIPRGGSQAIANSLASYFKSLGGEIVTSSRVRSLREVENFKPILLDITPRQFVEIAGDRLPRWFEQKLSAYRYGPGVFKIDWALERPIPWRAADCSRAGTVHLGGTLDEIAASERAPHNNVLDPRPFVLLVQPSLFDPARAPAGQHTAWAYCHVPNGSTADMTEAIEAQVERFAPGFRNIILARHTFTAAEMPAHNANLVGGDVTGGMQNISQLLNRPTAMLYRTPLQGVYLCSASTPPGGGVHGMCGFYAARAALRDLERAERAR